MAASVDGVQSANPFSYVKDGAPGFPRGAIFVCIRECRRIELQRSEVEVRLPHVLRNLIARQQSTLAAILLFAVPNFAVAQSPVDQKDQTIAEREYGGFERPVSLPLLLPNILRDQVEIWRFPLKLAHGKGVFLTTGILGTAAGLSVVDPHEAGYFRGTSSFDRFNHVFSSRATMIGILAAPMSLYILGSASKDSKLKGTALLTAEAMADAEILTTALKASTRRLRPAGISPKGNFSDSWFDAGGAALRGASFPSGHTIMAMSAATVIARWYGNHKGVPYTAYGLAALVGVSRLTLSDHFLSDVFVGGRWAIR